MQLQCSDSMACTIKNGCSITGECLGWTFTVWMNLKIIIMDIWYRVPDIWNILNCTCTMRDLWFRCRWWMSRKQYLRSNRRITCSVCCRNQPSGEIFRVSKQLETWTTRLQKVMWTNWYWCRKHFRKKKLHRSLNRSKSVRMSALYWLQDHRLRVRLLFHIDCLCSCGRMDCVRIRLLWTIILKNAKRHQEMRMENLILKDLVRLMWNYSIFSFRNSWREKKS